MSSPPETILGSHVYALSKLDCDWPFWLPGGSALDDDDDDDDDDEDASVVSGDVSFVCF